MELINWTDQTYIIIINFIISSMPHDKKGEQMSFDAENICFKVVLNSEEQYSIWPKERPNPLGWKDGGIDGTKEECLAYIDQVWTDMRPLSLRKKMAALESNKEAK